MKTYNVTTGRPYDILIGEDLLQNAGKYLQHVLPNRKIAVITDSNVGPLYGGILLHSLRKSGFDTCLFTFPAGETSKNITTYGQILEFLAAEGLTRTDAVLALGGGVPGDIAGFAAATYLRGIPYVQVPTTYLAAVDSSVGGKTGIDLTAGKNLAGNFWQPSLVITDYSTFRTLSRDEMLNGVAEAVKCSMLQEKYLIPLIQESRYESVIEKCVSIKKNIVEQDERDTGVRQLLNFGHTVGHTLEKLSGFSLPHGHAVAKGMVAESRAAYRMGLTTFDASGYLADILTACGFDLSIPFGADDMYQTALKDKKRKGNSITVIVPVSRERCALKTLNLDELKEYFRIAAE